MTDSGRNNSGRIVDVHEEGLVPPDTMRPTISPADALERIRNGEVLRRVTIDNLVIRGEIDRDIAFDDCHLSAVQVTRARLAGSLQLDGCKVRGLRVHRETEITGKLSLRGCHIKKLLLQGAAIAGGLQLEESELRGSPRIRDLRLGEVRMWGTHVVGWLELHGVSISGKADLRSLTCEEGFITEGCRFGGPFLLRGSSFAKKLDLRDSQFDGALDLSKVKLSDFAYLNGIVQGSNQTFAFANALAERMHIAFDRVTGRLASERDGDFETAATEYALLKSNYQNLHRFDDEDRAFYRFRVAARKAKAKKGRRLAAAVEWMFLDVGCGYGADPWKAVRTALVAILFFAFVFFVGFDLFRDSAKVDVFNDGVAVTSTMEKAVFSVGKSVSVFTAGLAGDQLLGARGWMMLPLAVEALLGTFLWGLFIVAFGRKVIR